MAESPVISTQDYTLTGDEAAQIFRDAVFQWRDYILVILVIGLPYSIVTLGDVTSNDPNPFGIFLTSLLFGLPLLIYIWHPFRRMRQMRRHPNRLVGLADAVTQRHEFDQQVVTTSVSDGTSVQRSLRELKLYVVVNDSLFLYLPRKQFVVIPLRAFATPSDAERVYALLNAQGVKGDKKHPKGLFAT